jgi:hypothetical protein
MASSGSSSVTSLVEQRERPHRTPVGGFPRWDRRRVAHRADKDLRSDLDLVYWGIGNPSRWNQRARKGDNLYNNSIFADVRSHVR